MKHREGAEPWVFYEGPPRQWQARTFITLGPVYKDLFCRYQTMQGRTSLVAPVGTPTTARRGQVEKQLASRQKAIVEQVASKSSRGCAANRLTSSANSSGSRAHRYWTDMEHAYYTSSGLRRIGVVAPPTALRTRSVCMRTSRSFPTARAAVRPSPARVRSAEVYTTKWTKARTSVS